MFEHILIPVDFTEQNNAALDVAFDMAVQFGSRITLLHVIERIEHAEEAEIRDFYTFLESRATENLDQMARRFVDRGIDLDGKIEYGKRAREIIRYSAKNDFNLVILSSHKIDLNEPLSDFGTLSHQVSIFCQCPVLMVK